MERKTISKQVYEKVVKNIPKSIIQMLPDKPENLLKYATRVKELQFSKGISDSVKQLMKEHLLSDEEYLKTFYYVMAITFYNKKPVEKPKLYIVAAQTGSGKSNLTAKILRENENMIFVDSDKYKHFRFDAQKIAKNYQVLYPYLTGPDSYDHADNVYQYAIENKYNIIKESAPSLKIGLLKWNLKKDYKVSVHILAVSKLNSLLSVHERYELQIIYGLKTAKLTGIERHNESYKALEENVRDIEENVEVYVYKRGKEENNFEPIRIYPNNKYNSAVQAIRDERMRDYAETKREINDRYDLIVKQMESRNAPKEQFIQLKNIYQKGKEDE